MSYNSLLFNSFRAIFITRQFRAVLVSIKRRFGLKKLAERRSFAHLFASPGIQLTAPNGFLDCVRLSTFNRSSSSAANENRAFSRSRISSLAPLTRKSVNHAIDYSNRVSSMSFNTFVHNYTACNLLDVRIWPTFGENSRFANLIEIDILYIELNDVDSNSDQRTVSAKVRRRIARWDSWQISLEISIVLNLKIHAKRW